MNLAEKFLGLIKAFHDLDDLQVNDIINNTYMTVWNAAIHFEKQGNTLFHIESYTLLIPPSLTLSFCLSFCPLSFMAYYYSQPPSTLGISNIGLGLYLDGWLL